MESHEKTVGRVKMEMMMMRIPSAVQSCVKDPYRVVINEIISCVFSGKRNGIIVLFKEHNTGNEC